jgi:hypothetical protein
MATTTNGEDAVEFDRPHQDEVACALLDLAMPRMNGEEARPAASFARFPMSV